MSIEKIIASKTSESPLVFMGGTCPGPKWRDRLIGQVRRTFSWFDPVVTTWTAEQKEIEDEVKKAADILLYLINPYQQGYYSFAEITESVLRSGKEVVVALLPTYEDRSFDSKKWASLTACKGMWEAQGATVLISMEETIDWFSGYNPKAQGSTKFTPEDIRRQAKQDQIGNGLSEQPKDETTPTTRVDQATIDQAKATGVPQTDPMATSSTTSTENGMAVSSEDFSEPSVPVTLSMEGILNRLFGPRYLPEKSTTTLADPDYGVSTYIDQALKELDAIMGSEQALRNLLPEIKDDTVELTGRFEFNGIRGDLTKHFDAAGKMALSEARRLTKLRSTSMIKLHALEEQYQAEFNKIPDDSEHDTDREQLVARFIKDLARMKYPVRLGEKSATTIGGRFARLIGPYDALECVIEQTREPAKPYTLTFKQIVEIVNNVKTVIHQLDTIYAGDYEDSVVGLYMDDGMYRDDSFIDAMWGDPANKRISEQWHAEGSCKALAEFIAYPAFGFITAFQDLMSAIHRKSGTKLAFEGFVDFIGDFFVETVRSPFKAKGYLSRDYIKDNKRFAANTLMNQGWVERHLRNSKVSNGSIANALCNAQGVVVSPAEALATLKKEWNQFLGKVKPQVVALDGGINVVVANANEEYKAGKRGEAAIQLAVDAIKQLSRLNYNPPAAPNFSLGGASLTKTGAGYKCDFNGKAKSKDLAVLTAKEIVDVTKGVFDFHDKFWRDVNSIPVAGDGCDTGIWSHRDGWDYDHLDGTDGEDVYDYCYFQSKPADMVDYIDTSLEYYLEVMVSIVKWVYMATGGQAEK